MRFFLHFILKTPRFKGGGTGGLSWTYPNYFKKRGAWQAGSYHEINGKREILEYRISAGDENGLQRITKEPGCRYLVISKKLDRASIREENVPVVIWKLRKVLNPG